MADPANVISGVIVHLQNDMPVLVDLDELPKTSDRVLRCTNVRTLDGKRPTFVHDPRSTFFLPLSIIRMIEAPATSSSTIVATYDDVPEVDESIPLPGLEPMDEEAEEDLLARIRQI